MPDQSSFPNVSLDSIQEPTIENVNLDRAAEAEALFYSAMDRAGKENEFNRQEKLKKMFHSCAMWLLRVLAICIVLLIISRLSLLLIPTKCRWLSKEEINEIDQLFSYIIIGSVGSFVFKYFQNNIDRS